MKKLKVSACFQQKLATVQGTHIREETEKAKDSTSKASGTFKLFMMRKFESDLEKLLCRIANKFKKRQSLEKGDIEQVKLLSIIREFENNKFSGCELISSNIGKIFKALKILLNKNTSLLPDLVSYSISSED